MASAVLLSVQSMKSQDSKNILNSRSGGGLNKKFLRRSRNRIGAESHGCNTVQDQEEGKKLKFDKINKDLVKIAVSSTSRPSKESRMWQTGLYLK